MNWLVKEEPDSYSFEQLTKDGGTTWSGVKNPLAQKHLRSMSKGDRILYYHTGAERAVVGIARAAGAPSPDPADPSGKRFAIAIAPVAPLPRPVTLQEIKATREFAQHPLVRIGRLSVMPVSDGEWRAIERLARAPGGTSGRKTPRIK